MAKTYTHHQPGQLITRNTDNIEVDGHYGKWYVIDEAEHNGQLIFLLEHELYGDDAAALVVDENGVLLCRDAYNGFDDFFDNLY